MGSTGEQLSRGFDLNYGRDEMTSGGQREHNVDVLEQNLRNMELDPQISHSTQMDSATEHHLTLVGDWRSKIVDGPNRFKKRQRNCAVPKRQKQS